MNLTDVAIRQAKPGSKRVRMFDGDGLYLELSPAGGKWWRFKYRYAGRERRLSLGIYPEVSLRDARERCVAARKLVANGVDPAEARHAEKLSRAEAGANSFEVVAREWHGKNKAAWTPSHADKILRRLERDVFPWIGTRHVGSITPPELLTVLRRIESRGAIETAHRAQQNTGQVLRYAVATGRAESDPSRDLRSALTPWKPQHYASITEPRKVGQLLRDIDGYKGGLVVRIALRLSPLVFVRPGELRRAEWSEFDLDAAEWRIPPEKMKARVVHIVPLATQAVAMLRELQPLTGHGRWVFPGIRANAEPMSENTVNAALRRLGYDRETITAHGFRSMASTILHEQGWPSDVIERQLSHSERDEVKAAYNYAQHLPKRRELMQAWADFLDGLREGAEIVPLRVA